MTQPENLESLLCNGGVGDACRLLAAPLRAVLLDRARRLHLPAHLVEDALQEAFLRLLLYHGRFDPARGSAWTWVQTIANNALLDLARQHGRRAARPLFGRDGGLLYEPAAPGPAADLEAATRLVEDALAGMNPRHREAVQRRLAGEDQKSVGRTLGMRPGNVAVVFHHFRARVKEMLA